MWDAMCKVWPIPAKEEIHDTGVDWMMSLLAGCSRHDHDACLENPADSVRCYSWEGSHANTGAGRFSGELYVVYSRCSQIYYRGNE